VIISAIRIEAMCTCTIVLVLAILLKLSQLVLCFDPGLKLQVVAYNGQRPAYMCKKLRAHRTVLSFRNCILVFVAHYHNNFAVALVVFHTRMCFHNFIESERPTKDDGKMFVFNHLAVVIERIIHEFL
jgi:hypothetical protein